MSDEGVALAYDNVTFRYPGSHGDVLSGVSMAVPAGAFALLVQNILRIAVIDGRL